MAGWDMAPLEMSPYPPFDPLSPYSKSKNSSKLPPISQGGPHTQLPKPRSKLQLLQHEFQQKLEREKQSKLMAIYKQQYQDALYRLRTTFSQSVVRREIHRSPGIEDQWYAGSPTCQRLACEEPDSGWTQVAIGPQGKRSAGVDRACPLRPIERKTSSLSNISNLEAEFSESKCFRTLDPTMWPNAPFRPSPPKEPCNYSRGHCRSRERYLRTSENSQSQLYMSHNSQHKRSPSKKEEEEEEEHWPKDLQEQEDNYPDHFEQEISKKESFIQGRLRKIEEELRQLQIERDRAEEQEIEEREMRGRGDREMREREEQEIRREEREMRKDREIREKEEREKRREREMRRDEREMRGREDREMRGREEKERREIEREERREREKARLAEVEREEKHRQRERLKRDSGRMGEREKSYREGHSSGKTNSNRCRETESEDESDVYASEEYSDHSNPFADCERATSQVKSSKDRCSAKRESTDSEQSPRDEQAESGQGEDRYSPDPKAKCSNCGRRFVLDRVDTHVEICKKVYKHKRKVYDSAKKRAQGTDMENYQSNRKRVATPKKNWKQKHDAFIRMLRAAQQIELQIFRGKKQSDLPPPPPAENPDYVPCPHCKRRFKAEAAERHIPTCKKLRNRPPPLRR